MALAMTLGTEGALAQAGAVQIYGSLAVAVSHRNHQVGNASLTDQSNSQLFNSYLGFRGTEDLGGGLSAMFRLEGALAPDVGNMGATVAGNSKFYNRQSHVGLNMGSAGTLTLGRQFHAGVDRAVQSLDVYNLAGSSLFSTPLAVFGGNRYVGNDSRVDNSLKYRINLPAGLTVGASKGLGEQADSSGGGSWSLDVAQITPRYALGVYTMNYRSPNTIAATGARPTYQVWGLGGNVDVGFGRLYVHYMNNEADATTATGVSTVNRISVLGLSVPVGATTLKAAWTHDKAKGLNGVAGRDGAKDTLVMSAEYAFSRRTSVHAAYFLNRFKDGYKLDPVNLAALGRDPAASSVAMVSVGMRHDF
jgi:predicted porin